MFLFMISYLLVANFIPMNANVSDFLDLLTIDRSYLILVYLLIGSTNLYKSKLALVVVIPLIAVYGFRLIKRNADFKNEIVFYDFRLF